MGANANRNRILRGYGSTFHPLVAPGLRLVQPAITSLRHHLGMTPESPSLPLRNRLDCAACYLASLLMAAHLTTMTTLVLGKIIFAVMPFAATALVRRQPGYTSPHLDPVHTCDRDEIDTPIAA